MSKARAQARSAEVSDKPADDRMRLILGALDAVFPEVLKKAFFTGAGMLFLTEEGVRKTLSEMRYPREIVNFIVEQTNRSRRELFGIVKDEVRGFLKKIDPAREMRRILDGMTLEVAMQLKFKADQNKATVSPGLKASVRRRKERP